MRTGYGLLPVGSYRDKTFENAASSGISREQFVRGPLNFTRLSGTIGPKDASDMTSLNASSRLQNATPQLLHKIA